MPHHSLKTISCSVSALFLVAALTGSPREARGSAPLNWFGNDARSAAMGGGGAALGSGPSTLLMNPALMSFGAGGVWVTFSAAPNWMSIDLEDRPAGYDVPDSIYQTSPVGWTLDRPVPTSMLTKQRRSTKDLSPAYLLSITAMDSFFHQDLKLGLGFTTPLPRLISVESWYNDEREQYFSNQLHFERFGEFDSAVSFYPSASFAPLEWLSLGFTLKIDLALALDAKLFLTEGTEWEYMYLDSGGEVKPSVRPIAAVAFRTPIGLRFGAVYRHQSYVDIDVDVDLRVWNGERPIEETGELQQQFQQSHRMVFGFVPREVELAAAYEHGPFAVEAAVAWQQYSEYLDRHGNNWSHPSWDDADDTTVDGWDDDWKDPRFDDVWTVRGGAEWWVVDWAAIRAGAGYFPSPMPPQTGRYNYVDNDLVLYSLGAGFRWQIAGRWLTADVAGQLWHMQSLTVKKTNFVKENGGVLDEVPDDVVDYTTLETLPEADGYQINNPGYPGYSLGGVALNVAVMIGMEFD